MPTLTVSNSPDIPDKPVAAWNSADFIKYYRAKLYEFSKLTMKLPSPAWAAYAGRIKGFRSLNHISNETYKAYIDFFFDRMCRQHNFVPDISALFSIQVWNRAKQLGLLKS